MALTPAQRRTVLPVRPGSPKKSPAVIEAFLNALRASFTPRRAAEIAGVALSTARSWKREDEEFAAQWEEAYDEGTDVLEQEAQRRAVEGYDEVSTTTSDGPKGQFKSETVTRKYSDTLVNLMLQGRRPEKYRKSAVELTGPGGGPIRATVEVEFVDSTAPAPKGGKK